MGPFRPPGPAFAPKALHGLLDVSGSPRSSRLGRVHPVCRCPSTHPRRLRGPSCPLSSSYFFYKYIVVVVEGSLACGQLHFCQCWRALSPLPTLCSPPCSRCLPSGDKNGASPFSVDKPPVVPKLSPVLRTVRIGGRKRAKTKVGATASCTDCSSIDSK